ncbi:MAG: YbaB/EbfC family nucleoid-associated protein [Opitutales bacterium]|nr:YbaB/EbfC family nucleoid-associated protein [Opitutales bacterium]MCH8540232.1 YbaB/EbfC family nucleoid-associated protein [Opitutales bacterium]
MAGVGKLLKQAQKMQRQIDELQAQLAEKELEFSSGGGAVKIKIMADGVFKEISLDDEFLKEDKEFVEETLLAAVQEAAQNAKEYHGEEMQKVTSGFNMPGMF